MRKSERYKADLEMARQVVDTPERLGKLLRRLRVAGSDITREEIQALAVLQPVLKHQLMHAFLNDIWPFKKENRRLFITKHLESPRQRDQLKHHHDTQWAIGHLAVLSCPMSLPHHS
jgi:hypothetical protein